MTAQRRNAREDTTSTALVPTSQRPAPIQLFLACVENDVENDYDGGRLMLAMVRGQLPEVSAELLEARLVMVAARDPFMRQFPVTREEKQNTFFRLTIEQVAVDELPPDPTAPPELYNKDGARVDPAGRPLPGFDKATGEPR